jgi:hypothetical protein
MPVSITASVILPLLERVNSLVRGLTLFYLLTGVVYVRGIHPIDDTIGLIEKSARRSSFGDPGDLMSTTRESCGHRIPSPRMGILLK